ncbi:MAG: hypothetical protein KA956_02880 [Pyrinomonadaceae bacterium]|nr:hypothetical protein [Pyrinomonadaceae bacterium]
MKKYSLIALFVLAVFFGSSQIASACSCVVPPPGETLKSQVSKSKVDATAIFVGTVVSIRFSDDKINDVPVKRIAKFKVERSWKGPSAEFVEVESANVCCLCGIAFSEGQRYIVYSNSPDPVSLSASSCSRTSAIERKSDDERYLGKQRKIKRSSK